MNAVVQITLNIPGAPKQVQNDFATIIKARDLLLARLKSQPAFSSSLRNEAGAAIALAFSSADPVYIKTESVQIEDGPRWGRALDIDVITESGAVSRECLGMPQRACIICDNSAKICAKLGAHSYAELRERTALLIKEACQSPEESSLSVSPRIDKSSR